MKKILLAVTYFCCALVGCGSGNEKEIPGGNGWDDDPEEKVYLAVMSYNVRHCAPYYGSGVPSDAEVNNIAKVLKEKNPDVVLLQEVDSCTSRSFGIDQVEELSKLSGFKYYYFFKQKTYGGGAYGAGILSKYKLSSIVNHKLPTEIDGQQIKGSNVLGSARITFKGKDIYLGTTHLSVTESERVKQFPFVLAELNKLTGAPVILGGDFNSKPDHSVISSLDSNGFKRTNNDPTKFTIPSDKPNRELDYIAFKPDNAFNVISHTVFTGINASDHLPIVSVLKPL
ncbi:hypothetical protein IX307_001483 [Bacteroides pyogenes]|uniref:endonuclease/exonuclease/phosphatase family protein n=1 Tax=Bacteroides pyogenes TaxID=310300 RepID=UPI001BA502AB|nr:endonuclease/exonuclease/phosphatase family protein [Bacteroides pyogenes]MBR8720374.1 hypothetical protein [Bacteroides pyogenes]MBR8724772.1 hypothetical protein [Bacteroides pyogenes]MBR8738256.1 hypothetical protein [Bacteroides pyogenes]MBR8754004.1 hypothetical protein [Bacteroides pyogenes]MBR8787159.1 hypothetical protein [Bacteroides pyogenes]